MEKRVLKRDVLRTDTKMASARTVRAEEEVAQDGLHERTGRHRDPGVTFEEVSFP